MMSLSLIQEVWQSIKPSVEVGDTTEAAEVLVNYLVEHDFDKQEIKSVFKHHPEVQKALSFYIEKPEDFINAVDDEVEDEDDYDNDYYDEEFEDY